MTHHSSFLAPGFWPSGTDTLGLPTRALTMGGTTTVPCVNPGAAPLPLTGSLTIAGRSAYLTWQTGGSGGWKLACWSPANGLTFIGNDVGQVAPVGDLMLCSDTDATGQEPWITDGTVGGTRFVADTNPGAGSSLASPGYGYPAAVSSRHGLFGAVTQPGSAYAPNCRLIIDLGQAFLDAFVFPPAAPGRSACPYPMTSHSTPCSSACRRGSPTSAPRSVCD